MQVPQGPVIKQIGIGFVQGPEFSFCQLGANPVFATNPPSQLVIEQKQSPSQTTNTIQAIVINPTPKFWIENIGDPNYGQSGVLPVDAMADFISDFSTVGLTDFSSEGAVRFAVKFADPGSGLIAETQEFKFYFVKHASSLIILAIHDARFVFVDFQLNFL